MVSAERTALVQRRTPDGASCRRVDGISANDCAQTPTGVSTTHPSLVASTVRGLSPSLIAMAAVDGHFVFGGTGWRAASDACDARCAPAWSPDHSTPRAKAIHLPRLARCLT
jgi:hypothetical protein